jgi:phosphatidylinositol-3-phosphatase
MQMRTGLLLLSGAFAAWVGVWGCSSSNSTASGGDDSGLDSTNGGSSGSSSGSSSGGSSGSSSGGSSGSSSGGSSSGSMDAGADADSAASASINHIFYIMMENHAYPEIVGNMADAPYINQLATSYGVATHYYGVTHPSLPNYLAAISGDFQGIWDDCAAGASVTCAPEEFVPTSGDNTSMQLLTPAEITSATATPHWFSGQNIVDQLETKGLTWKAYMQSIPAVGSTVTVAPNDVVDGGDGSTTIGRSIYVQKHDPFMYFSDIRNSATRMNLIVPDTQLATDLAAAATTPNFVWLSPDSCHDMHGASPATATAPSVNIPSCGYPASGLDHAVITLGDNYVKSTVMAIMASPAWQENSVIVIPWDEDDYAGFAGCCDSPTGADGGILGGANAPAIVITSKNPKHQSVDTPFNHYSLLATIEQVWGLPCLANACAIGDAGASNLMTSLFIPQ